MAHLRERQLKKRLEAAMRQSPIVGVLGQRQTGKTTLVRGVVGTNYVSLDDALQLEAARSRPKGFLEGRLAPFGVDECQLAPELFPALKEAVFKHKRPGQFVLTGSVRFTSRAAIRESLTGRILNLELLPFTLAESQRSPLGNLFSLAEARSPKAMESLVERCTFQPNHSAILRYLRTGGLPGICFSRSNELRSVQFGSHIETLLERDLRLLVRSTLEYRDLFRLMRYLAQIQGIPFQISDCVRRVGISAPTVKQLLSAFQGLFLIRRLDSIGDVSRVFYYLEDQGMAHHLHPDSAEQFHLSYRALLAELTAQNAYQHAGQLEFAYYEAKSGSSVPLVLKKGNVLLGIVPLVGEVPTKRERRAALGFLSRFRGACCVLVSWSDQKALLGDRLLQLPISAVYGIGA